MADRRPNIVLYVLDSLRVDHVSAYGYDRETTPEIDSLAEDGVQFEQCISPSTWTRPVSASLLSGLYPPVHQYYRGNSQFDPPRRTLAERLSDLGYDTLGIGSGNLNSEFGYDRGFDTYIDDIGERAPDQAENTAFEGTRGWEIRRDFNEWLDERDGRDPFFAMLWSTGPHLPFNPPEGYRHYLDEDYDGSVDGTPDSLKDVKTDADHEQLQGYYDGEIEFNDHCIGLMRDDLRERGLYDETAVFCTSDHGEMLGDQYGVFGHGSQTPYEGLLHVPLIVRTPNDVAGERVESQIGFLDLHETFVDLAGGDPDDGKWTQSESFAPALHGEEIEGHEFVYAACENVNKTLDKHVLYLAVRSPEWKYIESRQPGEEADDGDPAGSHGDDGDGSQLNPYVRAAKRFLAQPTHRKLKIIANPFHYYQTHRENHDVEDHLYHLAEDPDEQQNLGRERPDRAEEMAAELDAWLEECARLRRDLDVANETVEIDDDLEEHLADLGYK